MHVEKNHATGHDQTILVVDDHPLIREGISNLLSLQPGLEVVAEADTQAEALRQMKLKSPDLAIIDLTLKDSGGLDLIAEAHRLYPDMMILVFSMHDEGFYVERALRAGARGYVAKEEGPQRILEAVGRLRQGKIYVSEKIAAKIPPELSGGDGHTGGNGHAPHRD